jgi:CheY-like chemotaxis protein
MGDMDTRQGAEGNARGNARAVTRRSRRRPFVMLVADDVPDTRELYTEYFEHRGCRVITAPDGASAVQAALDHAPDVIVMDLAMPQIDGITAIQRIKARSRKARSRVILLTGYPRKEIERRAYEAGADLFLRKPCLPHELERHIVSLHPRGKTLAPGTSS